MFLILRVVGVSVGLEVGGNRMCFFSVFRGVCSFRWGDVRDVVFIGVYVVFFRLDIGFVCGGL